eukprot:CAMPEP_0119424148 /NCGR_PEP_ID=MMETSP1335-20130426/31882_1 /TAXON_ID=259385 /ORGANISM="Chrysoculter rhomboideus, Strain RCC1486" /LENGTH=142 /DNA_ID=CAMNT_0007449661 /DNA_START=193 /DNA_END=623 /DNA_ORIENTATION=-
MTSPSESGRALQQGAAPWPLSLEAPPVLQQVFNRPVHSKSRLATTWRAVSVRPVLQWTVIFADCCHGHVHGKHETANRNAAVAMRVLPFGAWMGHVPHCTGYFGDARKRAPVVLAFTRSAVARPPDHVREDVEGQEVDGLQL